MKTIQIRNSIFETNSSSTHSITICTKEEFAKFKSGELVWIKYENCLLPKDQIADEYDEYDCSTYDKWGTDLKKFKTEYTTKGGETIIAFGEYGEDR